jgi:hypothetical protein
MKAIISMSGSLRAFIRGILTPEEMVGANFYFSCAFGHIQGIPYEATWENTELPKRYANKPEEQLVSLDEVDPGHRAAVMQYMKIVNKAHKDDRVHCRCGNQPGVIARLPVGTRIFWQFAWETKEAPVTDH